jgi:malonate transporter and related proteins
VRLSAGKRLDQSFSPVFYGGYLAAGGLVSALAFALARIPRRQPVVAAAARPTALFALGGTLALHHLDRATVQAAGWITAARLLVYPALA